MIGFNELKRRADLLWYNGRSLSLYKVSRLLNIRWKSKIPLDNLLRLHQTHKIWACSKIWDLYTAKSGPWLILRTRLLVWSVAVRFLTVHVVIIYQSLVI